MDSSSPPSRRPSGQPCGSDPAGTIDEQPEWVRRILEVGWRHLGIVKGDTDTPIPFPYCITGWEKFAMALRALGTAPSQEEAPAKPNLYRIAADLYDRYQAGTIDYAGRKVYGQALRDFTDALRVPHPEPAGDRPTPSEEGLTAMAVADNCPLSKDPLHISDLCRDCNRSKARALIAVDFPSGESTRPDEEKSPDWKQGYAAGWNDAMIAPEAGPAVEATRP